MHVSTASSFNNYCQKTTSLISLRLTKIYMFWIFAKKFNTGNIESYWLQPCLVARYS